MEENRRFGWSGLFIKAIIVIIFVLFTIWLLSLSNKGVSNSLDVLTNNIFSQNIEKMKEVGKNYFTTERLPKKIGEIETITLEEMYEEKLILELVDKNGNACSAKNSYVSVEKYDEEYQMKVYLECGNESDYIIVIMGCYDYCDTDICEKKEEVVDEIEYEYVKTTGGKWTDYGKWSDWSKVAVTKTDYRQIETKIEKEQYSYNKIVTDTKYIALETSCPEGYKLTADGEECYKLVGTDNFKTPVCPTVSGYILLNRDGFTCTYGVSGNNTISKTASCPEGYTQSGTTCVKNTSTNVDPVCPTVSGYTFTGRSGFTCNYSKNSSTNVDPVCPTLSGYIYTGINGLTCNYVKYVKGDYIETRTGSYVPGNDKNYIYEEVGDAVYTYACLEECKMQWVHTYKVYKAKTENKTQTASCPTGSTKSGNACVKGSVETTTKTASCPTGSTKSGNTCVKAISASANPVCPTVFGYTNTGRNGFVCSYKKDTVEKDASCPTGYTKLGNTCYKYSYSYDYEDVETSCPTGYKLTSNGNKCYKIVNDIVTVTDTRDVTYYRYRVREYKGGTTDYKWSKSKEDKDLLNAGYKLTGKTR